MSARVTVVTAGHLSTCPRMLKAADALAAAGHEVRVVSTRFVDWATSADEDVRRTRTWRWSVVDYARASSPARALLTGARRRTAAALAGLAGPRRAPWPAVTRAFGRVHPELVRAVAGEPADLVYGGTTGALAAAAEGAAALGARLVLDLEDWHTGESSAPDAALQHGLADRVQARVLSRAAALTTSSDAIGAAYRSTYGVSPITIHNVFALPAMAPAIGVSDAPLRLYWFGQTIGPGRGLEDAVDALALADIRGVLHVRGRADAGFARALERRAAAAGVALTLLPPVPPDQVVPSAQGYDIGLAAEAAAVENRALCISNKLLTFPLAGLAVVCADTVGAAPVIRDLGAAALVYAPGDVESLARGLAAWDRDREGLAAARRASWGAAVRRWHWEHPLERDRLVAAVDEVLGRPCES